MPKVIPDLDDSWHMCLRSGRTSMVLDGVHIECRQTREMTMRTTTIRKRGVVLAAAVVAAIAMLALPGLVPIGIGATGQEWEREHSDDCTSDACTRKHESVAGGDTEARPYAEEGTDAAQAGPACAYGTPRCEQYSACSLHGDLSGATGETLEMYFRERTEDGRIYDDFAFPAFRALTLAGEETSSSALTGSPAVVAFVAAHCRHSMRAMPHLQEIADTYGPRGLRVVTVWVNSGSVEDVRETTQVFRPTYETWIHRSPAVGDAIGSHLVPSFFFIDDTGQVKEKFVGEKTRENIVARVEALLDASTGGE